LQGISIREFGRRDGCSDTLVRRALKSGHLSAFADGSLDASLVGTGWRDANRRAANGANTGREPRTGDPATVRTDMEAQPHGGALVRRERIDEDETVTEAAERLIRDLGLLTLAEAERLKENFLGRLKQLEYDIKSGAVATVAEVERQVAAEYAKVRTRLLAIPSELAPRVHHLKTLPEIQAALTEAIVEALEELTRDGAAAAT
jgi:hypothetical protein